METCTSARDTQKCWAATGISTPMHELLRSITKDNANTAISQRQAPSLNSRLDIKSSVLSAEIRRLVAISVSALRPVCEPFSSVRDRRAMT